VRHNTDILLGLKGSKKDALKILNKIETAIDQDLNNQTHLEKSRVKHHSSKILYLKYSLSSNLKLNKTQQSVNTLINCGVSIKRLLKSCFGNEFICVTKKGKNVKYVAKRVDK
jgi:hypothetical protein